EKIVARQITRLGALILEESNLPKPDPDKMAEVFLEVIREKGVSRLPWNEEAEKTRQRLAFLHQLDPQCWPDFSDTFLTEELEKWLLPHLTGLRSWNDLARLDLKEILLADLPWEHRTEMDKLAPTHLEVPTGSNIPLDYSKPEAPVLAVRLQEVFGMLET